MISPKDRQYLFAGLLCCFSLLTLWILYRAFRFNTTMYLAGAPPEDVIEMVIPKQLKPSELHPPAIRPNDPIRYGGTTSTSAVILYGDFSDAVSRTLLNRLSKIISTYHGSVRFVWRDLPLAVNNRSIAAAIFARCAQQQSKFWPAADLLAADPNLSEIRFEEIRTALQLDDQLMFLCRKDKSIRALIEQDVHDTQFDGIDHTPLFFIGTKAYTDPAMTDDQVNTAIRQTLTS